MKHLKKLWRESRSEIIGGLVVFVVSAAMVALYRALGIWLVLLIICLGLMGGCAYVAFKRTPPEREGVKGTWKYARWRPWALASLVIIPLLTAGGVGYHLYQQAQPPTIAMSPTDTPTIPKPTLIPTLPLDTPPPKSALTPTHVSVLFEEDFEDGLANDLVVKEGDWRVVEESSGNKFYEGNSNSRDNAGVRFAGSEEWKDYIVEYRIRLPLQQHSGLAFLRFRETGQLSYQLSFDPKYFMVHLTFDPGGNWVSIGGASGFKFKPEVWYSVRLEVSGTQMKVFIDDVLRIAENDSRLKEGLLALEVGPPNTIAHFDDIRVIGLGQ